jgi:hypothetical protein
VPQQCLRTGGGALLGGLDANLLNLRRILALHRTFEGAAVDVVHEHADRRCVTEAVRSLLIELTQVADGRLGMKPGDQPDPSHAAASSGQFIVTGTGRLKSAGPTTPEFGCRAGVRPFAREFVEILTVALCVSGESTCTPHLFRSLQGPIHRVKMIVGNAGRTTPAELHAHDRGGSRCLRTHYPVEVSSRRSVNAVLGGRQRNAYPDRA